MRLNRLLAILFILSGCSTVTPKDIPEEYTPPFIFVPPPKPQGLKLETPQYYIVTENTCEITVITNGPLFATDTLGYQQMARNIQEFRRYILELQNIVKYYEEVISEIQNDNQTDR